MNKFDDITDQVQKQISKAKEKGRPIVIHELKADINEHPGREYVAKHGTTGATISRNKTWIKTTEEGTLKLQDVKDVQCCPATGPRTEVRESQEITLADTVSRIVHDLEQQTYEDWRSNRYNPNRLEFRGEE